MYLNRVFNYTDFMKFHIGLAFCIQTTRNGNTPFSTTRTKNSLPAVLKYHLAKVVE